MKSRQLLSLSLLMAVSATSCTKKPLAAEAPKLSDLSSKEQVEAQNVAPVVSSAAKSPELPTVERVDEETARFSASSTNASAKVIADGKAVELTNFSVTSTILVAKDDVLYQVKAAKALEIPALEISSVGEAINLDVEVDNASEFSIIASSATDSDGVEIKGTLCLALTGESAGLLIDADSTTCWSTPSQLSPNLKIKASKAGFSLSLTGEKLLDALKRYPLLAVKVRSAPSDKLSEISLPVVTAPVEEVKPAEAVVVGPEGETAPAAVKSEVKESIDPDPVKVEGKDLAETPSVAQDEAVAGEEESAAAEEAVAEVSPSSQGSEVKSEETSSGVDSKQATESKPVIPIIDLPKDEDEIESLPVLLEALVLQDIKSDDQAISELKDLPFEAKARRGLWVEKIKQRLAVYKDKKRAFDDAKKERNKIRSERSKLRQDLIASKNASSTLCTKRKTKKEKPQALSDTCLKAKAAVANLEESDKDMTTKIAELKRSLEEQKQEAQDDLKRLKEAQANLKAVNLELKLKNKK